MSRIHRAEQGFILATAILAMVVVGAAVAGSYFIANQEYHVGKSIRQATHSFYAAEAGIQRIYATWSIRERWTMNGGNTTLVGPYQFENGSTIRGTVTRVDNTPAKDTDTERYYVIRTEGRSPSPIAGEEVVSRHLWILRVRYYDFCCSAAITAKDHFEQAGNSLVDGNNAVPNGLNESANWGPACDSASTDSLPGVEVECDTCFSEQGASHVTSGEPPVEVDTMLQSQSLLEWEEVTWDLLKSTAQKTYLDGETVTNTAPAVTTDPETGLLVCDPSVRSNWGEPTQPSHVCFDYFPIIYAQGSLTINSSAYGQGILLVEGDLTIKGGYQFYGVIVVRGHVLTEGKAGKIWGSMIVAGQNTGSLTDSRLAGAATVRYSACSVMRAKRFAELAKKEALPLRAWTEAL